MILQTSALTITPQRPPPPVFSTDFQTNAREFSLLPCGGEDDIISSNEMESAIRVQILDEAVCERNESISSAITMVK